MPIGFIHGCANSRVRNLRRVRPPGTLLHIGELVAQRGDAPFGETIGHRCHEGMRYPRAGAMRKHKTRSRLRRPLQKARDLRRMIDRNRYRLCFRRRHGRVPKQ